MFAETEAIIHLAARRADTLSGASTRADFITVNDVFLATGDGYKTQLSTSQSVLILPYIGDIEIKKAGKVLLLEENQALTFEGQTATEFEIANPYADDAINFFEVLLQSPVFDQETVAVIDVQARPNVFLPIAKSAFIGQFDGREEGVYKLQTLDSKLFVYVIEGVFEVQNRLLHARDALTLWHLAVLEFEALSANAILLIVEI
ncbi:MAG: hypothetical protein EAZ32_19770 [Cytophagia bacterium]|nr:MAG: hypothetical protein EAZ38_02395 [Cytophagales bacterium]TAG34382.1 MAG: hypothetical protein EAZ32_19770 [Cytophagia bacterium]TAG76617.1 MAG: hypothetical protein EAZ22_17660 [Cytophagales bacterium]